VFSIDRFSAVFCIAAFTSAVPAVGGNITLSDNTTANVDNATITRTFNILPTVPGFGSGMVTDVNVSVDFIKADGEDFNVIGTSIPYYGEIAMRVIAPSGAAADLINIGDFNNGAIGTHFDGVIVFDQSAALPVNNNPNLLQPGTFRPVGSLNALNGSSAEGTFTLIVQDLDTADSLRFRSATLDVTTSDVVGAVPEPGTMMFAVAGLAGILSLKRRK
jgi:hypothetical protein